MKIVIIGAGVSGLAAGIYARRNGFECEIYEQHSIAGGECTYWKRHGYTIDNCVHWMTGTNPESELFEVWKEVGVLGEGKQVIQNESFLHVECPEGQIDLWQDEERLRRDMLNISPADKDAIDEFVYAIKLYKDFELPASKPMEQMSILEIFKMLRRFRKLGKIHGKYALMSMPTLAAKFKHPLLQKAVLAYMPDFYNASSFFYVLGTFDSGNGALPKGGSAAISDNMLQTYLDLGGKIFYHKKAAGFNIEKRRAASVSFEDGSEVEADYFVAACDASVTFHKLLPQTYLDKYFDAHFTHRKLYPTYSSFNVYVGVDGDTSFLSDTTWIECEPYYTLGQEQTSFLLKSYATEPGFSPEGKNLLQVLIKQYEPDFMRWKDLYINHRETYREEKKHIADSVVKRIETHYPQLEGKLSVVETVSPYSFHRFCGAYMGAYMSFILTPYVRKKSHHGKVRKVKNIFLGGQWLQPPGGLPNAVVTGKFAIQRICKKAGIKFK